MKITVSEEQYKKAVFETDNWYTAEKFEKHLNAAKLPYELYPAKDKKSFSTFMTDAELEAAQEVFVAIEEANEDRMKKLRQQMDLLAKYFDSVSLSHGCDVQCVIYTNESKTRMAVNLIAFNGGTGVTWTTLERIIRREAGKGLQKRFDDLNFMEWDKPAEEVYACASEIQRRLEECLTAVEGKKRNDL